MLIKAWTLQQGGRYAKTLAELFAQRQAVRIEAVLPKPGRHTFDHQVQTALSVVAAYLTERQLSAHGEHTARHFIQLVDSGSGTHGEPLAITDLPQHRTDIADGPPQAMAQFACPHPHVGEKGQVKHHQAGNHQIADIAVMAGQTVRGRHDVFLVSDSQQSPARRLHLGPGNQMGSPPEDDFAAAARVLCERRGQLAGVMCLLEVQPFGLDLAAARQVRGGGKAQRVHVEIVFGFGR